MKCEHHLTQEAQYCAVQYSTVQYSTVQYRTVSGVPVSGAGLCLVSLSSAGDHWQWAATATLYLAPGATRRQSDPDTGPATRQPGHVASPGLL